MGGFTMNLWFFQNLSFCKFVCRMLVSRSLVAYLLRLVVSGLYLPSIHWQLWSKQDLQFAATKYNLAVNGGRTPIVHEAAAPTNRSQDGPAGTAGQSVVGLQLTCAKDRDD